MSPSDGTATMARHRSELGSWQRAWRRPAPPLLGVVSGYHGYHQRLAVPATHRGVPTATVALVISFGPPQALSAPDRRGVTTTVDSFVAGVHDRHVLIDAEAFHGVQVDLDLATARRLLGMPLRELTGRTVPLDDALGAAGRRLEDQLATAPSWPVRFALLDRELLRRCSVGADPDREVLHAWARIKASGGRVRVATLARETGWSPRRLSARFGAQLGLPPKRMANLVRFERAADLLARPGGRGLAEVAVDAGYYDQAHLANEVRKYSGLTPTELVAHRLPDHGGVFDLDPAEPARRSASSKTPR